MFFFNWGGILEVKDLQPFGDVSGFDEERLRAAIADLEEIVKSTGVEIECPVVHHFSRNVYAREMHVQKGVLLVGKIHKHQNLNILSAGEVSVLSVDGVKRVKAPYTFVASPGAKRVIYAHEDAVWTTIHGTPEQDVARIEDEVIAKSYDEVVALDGSQAKQVVGVLCPG